MGVIAAFTRGSVVVLSVLIGLCSFVIHGVNVLLLSSVPLQYVHFGKTSTLAGFLDFASYIGSAVMTMLTGVIVSVWGWKCLLLLWVVLFFWEESLCSLTGRWISLMTLKWGRQEASEVWNTPHLAAR